MTESPRTSRPPAPKRADPSARFLYGLVGGPLFVLGCVWWDFHRGGDLGLAAVLIGLQLFGLGVLQGLAFAYRHLALRPALSVAVFAAIVSACFLVVSHAKDLGATLLRLTVDPAFEGRHVGQDFSLQYPPGWRQHDFEGYEVWGYRPTWMSESACSASLGVGRSERAEYTLEAYVQWRRDEYSADPEWELLGDQPTTLGGLPGRELLVRNAIHERRLFITVKEQRAYIVSTTACRAAGGAYDEQLRSVVESFRF